MTNLGESRSFNQVVESCGASPGGAQWVKTAVDPFHDVDLDVIGMPDSTAGRSVVYAVTKNLTLDRPAGLAATSNWDCHIAFTPMIADAKLIPVGQTGASPAASDDKHLPFYQALGAGKLPRDSTFLTANSVESGSSTFVEGCGGVTGDCNYRGIGINQFLDTDGSSLIRVTGAAFEVHNTTEDVYKSGSVTTYKIARESDPVSLYFDGGITGRADTAIAQATITNGPPTNAGTAKLYNGHTWDAREGCLVPGVLDAKESDGEKCLPRIHCTRTTRQDETGAFDGYVHWLPGTHQSTANGTMIVSGILPRNEAGALNGVYNLAHQDVPGCSRVSPPTVVPEMMISGAYFTGLSPQTKLTLTLRVFVEVFPAAGNALVPLAHPANPYDAKAMQCYQEIMSHMRSGYRVGDNDAGDFFRKGLAAARAVARAMAPVLPPKVAAAVKVADNIAGKAEDALKKAKQVEKAVNEVRAASGTIKPRVRNRARGGGKALP